MDDDRQPVITLQPNETNADFVMNPEALRAWIRVGNMQIYIENNDCSVEISIYPYRVPTEENGWESGANLEPIDTAYAHCDDVETAFEVSEQPDNQ